MNSIDDKYDVIVGGGISGLFSAFLLKKNFPDRNVVLVEIADRVGGLLKSFDYGNGRVFDRGTHYLGNTGNSALNNILLDVLPKEEWSIFRGLRADASGHYYQGIMNESSPFLDLRNSDDYESLAKDFLFNLASEERPQAGTAESHFIGRYGKTAASTHIASVLENIFRYPMADLDQIAGRFIPLNRVVLFEDSFLGKVQGCSHITDRLAHTSPSSVPEEYTQDAYGFYPRKGGIESFVKGLESFFKDQGGVVLTRSTIDQISVVNGEIDSVTLKGESDSSYKVNSFIWAAGMPTLAKLLDVGDVEKTDVPHATVLVHLELSKPLACGDVNYFYNYDEHDLFRVTNYKNYNESEQRNLITAELIVNEKDGIEGQDIVDSVLAKLSGMGVLQEGNEILFDEVEVLPYGFPLPTLKNIASLRQIRDSFKALDISNLDVVGALSKEGCYFQRDILMDVYGRFGEV